MGGVKGLAVRSSSTSSGDHRPDAVEGKVFYRDERLLRNMIRTASCSSWWSTTPMRCQRRTSQDARFGLIQDDAWLLFPAKLYCGQSLLGLTPRVDHHRLRVQRRDRWLP